MLKTVSRITRFRAMSQDNANRLCTYSAPMQMRLTYSSTCWRGTTWIYRKNYQAVLDMRASSTSVELGSTLETGVARRIGRICVQAWYVPHKTKAERPLYGPARLVLV